MKILVVVIVTAIVAKVLLPDFQITADYVPWIMGVGFLATFGPVIWDCVRRG